MKNESYKLLKKDLKILSKNGKNSHLTIVSDLENILKEIDALYKIYNNNITEEDIKIIISNTYTKHLREIAYKKELEHNKQEIDYLEEQLEVFKKYFKNQEEAFEYSLRDECSFGNIKECQRIMKFVGEDRNGISLAFNACAIIFIILGLITSIVVGVVSYSFLSFLISCVIVLFSSLILFGLAELFQILHDIRKKIYLQK